MLGIRPLLLEEDSPLVGEPCALCGEPLTVGDRIIRCPEDRVLHHVDCWRANGNRCVALGCEGRGRVGWINRRIDDPDAVQESALILNAPAEPEPSPNAEPSPQEDDNDLNEYENVLEGELIEPGGYHHESTERRDGFSSAEFVRINGNGCCGGCMVFGCFIMMGLCAAAALGTVYGVEWLLAELAAWIQTIESGLVQ